jgi:hypothetical protein
MLKERRKLLWVHKGEPVTGPQLLVMMAEDCLLTTDTYRVYYIISTGLVIT